MRKLLALLMLATPVFAQQQVQPVAGVLTLNLVPGTSSFKVILSANVTSVVIVNPSPGSIISVIFTENATGGFTVAFGGNIANPCTITTTANVTTICQFQYDATSNTWNGIGGGGGGGASPKGTTDAGSSTIYLTDPKYNFPGVGQWSCQAGITNGSNIVTLPANDRVFTGSTIRNAQVGDVAWAANAECGGENAIKVPAMLITRTTICSVDSATQVHVGTVVNGACGTPSNASATCTVVAKDKCVFVWGPNAFTAVQAAWVDAGNACGTLILPAGGIMLSAEPNNTTAGCPGPAGGNDVGSSLTVAGQGPYVTMLLMYPDEPCTHNMFQDPLGGQRRNFHDFGVASFSPGTTACNGTVGFNMNFYGEFYNISFLDWETCDNISCSNNFSPLTATGVGNAPVYVHDNICLNSGNQGCMTINNGVVFTHNAIQNMNRCLNVGSVTGGSTFMSENSLVLCGIQGGVVFGGGAALGTIFSTNDTISCSGSTSLACIQFAATSGTLNMRNPNIGQTSSTTGQAIVIPSGVSMIVEGEKSVINTSNGLSGTGDNIVVQSGGTLTLRNVSLGTTTVGNNINNAGTVIFEEGNTFTGGPLTNTSLFQGVAGGVLEGACTGVVTSATTVALYGLGQNTASTCTVAIGTTGQVMSKPGKVSALYCTATAGNQAADACTVVKNGAAQTMTCSLNGVASCSDGAVAHVVSYVSGDILAIEAIGGTTTTLANVKGLIVAQ